MRIEADAVDEKSWFVMLFCVLCNARSMFGGERKRDNDECVERKCARACEESVKRLSEINNLAGDGRHIFPTSFT